MATFTRDWSEAAPAGTDAASVGDDEIRYLKVEVSDRLKALVYGFIAGENDGVPGCKNLAFKVREDNPTVATSTIVLYSKDVSDEAHLYMKDESNDVRQVSKAAGLLNIIAGDYAADSIDEDDIQLANNAPLEAKNAAGDDVLKLIKADASDDIILGDSTKGHDVRLSDATATGDNDLHLADKKYVDDNSTMVPAVTGAGTGYAGEESVTLPNGLIIKSGYIAYSASTTTVTFGTAFSAVISAQAATKASTGNYDVPLIKTLNTTTLEIYDDQTPAGYYWIAIGW